MKNTGVVRAIDELGRIVLPKELRRSLRIKEGDSLAIYLDENDSIILKKYSPIETIRDYANQLVDDLHASTKLDVIVTDKEKVIAANKELRTNIAGKEISLKLSDKMQKGNVIISAKNELLEVTDAFTIKDPSILKPIVVNGFVVGSVIIISDNNISEVEKVLANYATTFLSKYLSD